MARSSIATPTSYVRLGVARVEMTPPVGIYHRMWGAARHDQATGVHRPLFGDILVFEAEDRSARMVRAHLDLCTLSESQHGDLVADLAEAVDVPSDRVVLTYSHSHSAGWFVPNRQSLPGGDLIAPYLQKLRTDLFDAGREAQSRVSPVTITYATGHCSLAANRDYWDDQQNVHVCGFNPDAPADDTVVVARVTDREGAVVATLVNYACHPTTLAWENTLISPDYVGALREVVERGTGATCVFAQGACGDLGPRCGFVGDPAVADQNGRQLGYAALAALESMGPPGMDYHYVGPVVCGATLGVWAYRPHEGERRRDAERFEGATFALDLPYRPRPDRATLQQELAGWEARQREADQRGDAIAARDHGARAERARRWLGQLDSLPAGQSYPLPFSVFRLGDAIWITSGGEPYNLIQRELRRRFPGLTILFSPLAGGHSVAYLLPRDRYGRGLYQEEPSILAPGCLESLIEAVAARVSEIA